MELPQPRPFGTEGRRPTHDFLSLYGHSSVQQDPIPSSLQDKYMETHDFLQPLERVGKDCAKVQLAKMTEKQTPPELAPPSVEQHNLPGGFGAYTIGHISYLNHTTRVPKPEGGSVYRVAQTRTRDGIYENSNCTSFTESGLTLWDESTVLKKGKTRKENLGGKPTLRDPSVKIRQRTASSERQSQSSSSNNHRNSSSSLSYSNQSGEGRKLQSFMDVIKSAKSSSSHEEELDDSSEFVIKKETSPSHNGELRIKVEGKSSDQKANTPRSKHSATEQRRRRKINDRFQMLREIIPRSDQKRDKASFLSEVIEYIQFLQERVHNYEGSYQQYKQLNIPTNLKAMEDHKPMALSMSSQSSLFTPVSNSVAISDAENASSSRNEPEPLQVKSCDTDKERQQEMTIEGGTISISSMYSQGLLNNLTQALRSSGVDLTQASLSVQIELRKRPVSKETATTSTVDEATGDSKRDSKKLKPSKS